MPHLRSILGKLGFLCLGVLILFLVLEGALELRSRLSAVPQVVVVPQIIPDERLGHRPNPNFRGHDSRGWRNNSSPLERADIVVIGDSHVYRSAWPQRIGRALHRTVYQMGANGYGPAQYALLLDEALAFEPQIIIATYDFSDDIYDSYRFVHRIGDFKRSALDTVFDSSFALTNLKSQQALKQAETMDSELLPRQSFDCRKPAQVSAPRLQVQRDGSGSPLITPLGDEGILQRVGAFLTRHSEVIQVVRNRLFTTVAARQNVENVGLKLCPRYRDQKITSQLNPGYRLSVLDDTDPRIVEGERIAFLAYRLIAQRCRQPHCSFYVMMIPTKETAFRKRVESSLRDQSYMVDLWNAEGRARANASAFFAREHIAMIDTLPFLEELIASDVNPYPEDTDIHPVEVGYDAFARAAVERLARDGMRR